MTDAEVRSSTLSVTIVAQYETLRSAMLGEALPPVARSGLIVFLRHGMWEWARTLTAGALGREPLHVSIVESDGAWRTSRRHSSVRRYGNDNQ